ncbi:MAG: hypothetical protein IPI03_14360 [Rubrivivax sp.]|nr:hypothetical protein [Rubrivivax sp.]MBK8529152.1 hypothetical protein [Rubrivivax sp.]
MAALKLLHLLCFVYWLGGDLGTFYAAGLVVRRDLSPEARVTAARIMAATDLAPRVAMPLTVASGFHLAVASGFLSLPLAAVVAAWTLCAAWLGMVLMLHHQPGLTMLVRIDFAWRVALVAGLLVVALMGFTQAWAQPAPWLALKLAAFAATVFCGLMIRVRVRPFGPAFAQLARGCADDTVNRDIAQSLGGARPWVVGIWALLLLAAFTGLHGIAL